MDLQRALCGERRGLEQIEDGSGVAHRVLMHKAATGSPVIAIMRS